MLVAKNQRVCEQLARQFQARQIHKTYCAVVVGHLAAPAGEIAFPIGRHPTERKKMLVHARHSRSALSRYQVVAESQGVSFVRLFPETGRTHQLRVHMAAFGHPLVGDGVYGLPASKLGNAPGIVQGFSRQALHAEAIRFCHPVREEMMTLRSITNNSKGSMQSYTLQARALQAVAGMKNESARSARVAPGELRY
jgi:23S rRNA pseudouridine1911/1915/1917 synthase